MTLDWFLSSAVRQATAMRKHVEKLRNHQVDVLTPQALEGLNTALADMAKACNGTTDRELLEKEMGKLETAANKWLKPYPNASWRENVEVLLVALTVAMGIRTFFLQPFKIPTGSMQPSLFGVTSTNLVHDRNFQFPTGWERVRQWFAGVSYVHLVAEADGPITAVEPPVRFLIFNLWQKLVQGGRTYTIWLPPDYGAGQGGTLEYRAELRGEVYHRGEDMIKLKVNAGDHLFVDRVSYNFRAPARGEIIVFETRGIEQLPQDQFYIKRMVAMGGEHVQIGDDRHLIIDGKRLDSSSPHFENVYSFDPKKPPQESRFSGHVNQTVVNQYYPHLGINLAPLFPDTNTFTVASNHFIVMGDNTMNSLDSRTWGDFPASNVIGKSFFVYWPITDRFGWGYRR
jgi:signal peptidase I